MIPIENNSWDYVQRLIEREINSAFKLKETMEEKLREDVKTLEKRVETLEKKHQDLIDNIRIFMANEGKYDYLFSLDEIVEEAEKEDHA